MNKKKDDKKDVRLITRLSREDLRKLKAVMFWTDKSGSEIVRRGIDLVYKIERSRNV